MVPAANDAEAWRVWPLRAVQIAVLVEAAQMIWPCKHPYNKRWFQISVAFKLTLDRRARVAQIIAKWEPRLWAVAVNLPECLLA